ncbi:MAG: hypothetical protein FWF08_03615 [Oscillospiraceae bacterium]|nr:hypothetical protein [Oscillospiraceae bacterium]
MTYAILYHPGHNRVYFETSLKLSVSEFIIAARNLSAECGDIRRQNICGVDYLTFEAKKELSGPDIKIISGLSFVYALFKTEDIGGETYLKPIRKINENFAHESMGTILKYTGKTNEIFTRMMINIAVNSRDDKNTVKNENIKLLDPVAGKGTTLFEGLIKGYDVYGIEIGDGAVNEAYHFVKKFLETAKYKFEHKEMKISGPNKAFTALRHTFITAGTKEDFKNKNTKTVELIAGNSLYANKFYKKNFFDIIAGDLPYGVQHGNVTNEKQSSLTRNPAELLAACLTSWSQVLKPGGIIVLAWNSNVLPRKKMEEIFTEHGLTVKNDDVYLQFKHRVDKSILRDIIVGARD